VSRATVAEDRIIKHLNMLLEDSEPGATMHYMHVLSAPPDAYGPLGPLGPPDESKIHATIYAIAPTPPVNVDDFCAQVIAAAAAEAHSKGEVPLFAALSQEVWIVSSDGWDAEAERLMKVGRLDEHPAACEVTVVYGAASDGRRWTGRRWLTGPMAGSTEDVNVHVGRPSPREGMAVAPMLRLLVGVQ
jgi:hypothetical protein